MIAQNLRDTQKRISTQRTLKKLYSGNASSFRWNCRELFSNSIQNLKGPPAIKKHFPKYLASEGHENKQRETERESLKSFIYLEPRQVSMREIGDGSTADDRHGQIRASFKRTYICDIVRGPIGNYLSRQNHYVTQPHTKRYGCQSPTVTRLYRRFIILSRSLVPLCN